MHPVVMDSLEEYLAGELTPAALREIEAHLNTCGNCRDTVRRMQEVGHLLACLRAEDAPLPTASFYASVMQRVDEKRSAPSFLDWFSLDFAFGRRLVFASLMTLAVLGGYLVSRETDYAGGPSPESVMAMDSSSPSAANRDQMLVTLTSYEP